MHGLILPALDAVWPGSTWFGFSGGKTTSLLMTEIDYKI
jgi:hypothetical protein